MRRLLICAALIVASAMLSWQTPRAHAYVEAPMSLGAVLAQSSNVILMRVESVDRDKNLIIYRKVQDIKGKHPLDVIKHNIGRGGLRPNEWKVQMDWAEPGKMAVMFHNGGASETCIGTWWYQAYAGGEWWNHSHGEPFLCRSYAGPPEKLVGIITDMVAGKEVVITCMVDGNKEDLHNRRAKIQRMKASLKIQEYNPKRDFVGWGGDDFRRVNGLPGFTHYAPLTRVDPDAQAIASIDYDGDGKPDLCLVGAGRVVLVQNGGESLNEMSLPFAGGCRSAVWADYNGDGKPDLLLATPTGPKLFTNLGTSFRDDSHLLPQEPYYNLTAAAWIDYDGDGKPDVLLANGYHGLRLYKNLGKPAPKAASLKFGKWRYLGPFDNTGGRGFNDTHPVEKSIDLKVTHTGKGGEKISWKEGNFPDGAVNNLMIFPKPEHRVWSAIYLHREIETSSACDVPVSLGSDDTVSVWLNGQKILADPSYRACAPDQNQVVLKLKPGKNDLLLKVCQGDGDWAFCFQAGINEPPAPKDRQFIDVSADVGFGPEGFGKGIKGDTLTVADVNGDGRPDVLYGAGKGMLFLNMKEGSKTRFELRNDSGITYTPGKVGPVFADFDNDGHLDLFIPQRGGCKLFKGDGKGRFTDVTATTGDLAKFTGWATSAAWGDFDNDGHLDLVVGCLKEPNRFFRNKGDGTFEDCTEKVGLHQRIFNTQAVCLVDLNGDGILDMVFNNEGQESAVLMGNPDQGGKRTPVTVTIAGNGGIVGSKVQVQDKTGKTLATREISGSDGRGGQHAPQARFALEPGAYRVLVRYTSGVTRVREITVAGSPVRSRIDEETPMLE
jgi:FG-GAP-like repeat/FG-GAP repeat